MNDREHLPIDLDPLLDRCLGDRGFAADLLDRFLQKLPERVERLAAAALALDTGEVAREAHTLRGSAMNLAAVDLVDAIDALESAMDRPTGPSEALAALRAEAAELLDHKQTLLACLRSGTP
ncbi:MAG: Hpt domain-containing protein [Planctomycetota bacterium]